MKKYIAIVLIAMSLMFSPVVRAETTVNPNWVWVGTSWVWVGAKDPYEPPPPPMPVK